MIFSVKNLQLSVGRIEISLSSVCSAESIRIHLPSESIRIDYSQLYKLVRENDLFCPGKSRKSQE